MSEKPILFNTEMVRAILDGRKTQTRRVIRFLEGTTGRLPSNGDRDYIFWPGGIKRAPYRPGNFLWVRETWTKLYYVDPDGYTHYDKEMYFYAADGIPDIVLYDDDGRTEEDQRIRWKPSIHMPKSAARIWLQVKEAKAERLQDITNEDAKAEGVTCATDNSGMMHRHKFRLLWDGITPPEHQWDTNPWVWVIKFERVDPKCMCSSEKKTLANGSR